MLPPLGRAGTIIVAHPVAYPKPKSAGRPPTAPCRLGCCLSVTKCSTGPTLLTLHVQGVKVESLSRERVSERA